MQDQRHEMNLSIQDHIDISKFSKKFKYVGCYVLKKDENGSQYVLLQGRLKSFGKLTSPGGKIKKNEPPLHAACRELYEEAGIKDDALELVDYRTIGGRNGIAQYVFQYSGRWVSNDGKYARFECSSVKWGPRGKLASFGHLWVKLEDLMNVVQKYPELFDNDAVLNGFRYLRKFLLFYCFSLFFFIQFAGFHE